jgi:transcription initiation factor TFIID subunit 11
VISGVDGRSATGTSNVNGRKNTASVLNDVFLGGAEEDEDEVDEVVGDMTGEKKIEAELQNKDRHIAMLMTHADEMQGSRLETYKRVSLNKAGVRRIANQTLQQSLPGPVVNSIAGVGKAFITDLLERAMDVQMQWDAVESNGETLKDPDHQPRGPLQPEHLREALRRYKSEGEDRAPKLKGVSPMDGFIGSKRLFR